MSKTKAPKTRAELLRRKEELQYLATQFALNGASVPDELVDELAQLEQALAEDWRAVRAPRSESAE